MERVAGPSSSSRHRSDPVGLVIAAVVTTGVAALALIPLAAPGIDCARTPVQVSADTRGTSLQQVRQLVARDHATRAGRVEVAHDGPDVRELSVTDGSGAHVLGTVRVVRAPDDGWVVATTNTCDD